MTSGTVSVDDLHDNYFEIESTYTGENTVRPPVRIKFEVAQLLIASSNTPSTVIVGIQGITTDDALAAAVKTACEAADFTQQLTTAGGTSFSSAFTITVSNGVLTNNARLTFTQTEAGFGGNNSTPVFNKGFNCHTPCMMNLQVVLTNRAVARVISCKTSSRMLATQVFSVLPARTCQYA